MKRSRFSEAQIVGVLEEQEAGSAVADLCRKHWMSSATFFAWKARFGGLEVSDTKGQSTARPTNGRELLLLATASFRSSSAIGEDCDRRHDRRSPIEIPLHLKRPGG